jgi:hypothetical protein
VVPVFDSIALHGDPEHTLVWRDAQLGMRFGHDALFRCHRSRGLCPREALTLWLATPASNVVEIRHRRVVETAHGERTGALLGVIVGSAFTLLGIGLATGISIEERALIAPALGLGGAFVAGGTFFLVTGIRGLTARDSETIVAIP